jgi:hypothetical protein
LLGVGDGVGDRLEDAGTDEVEEFVLGPDLDAGADLGLFSDGQHVVKDVVGHVEDRAEVLEDGGERVIEAESRGEGVSETGDGV